MEIDLSDGDDVLDADDSPPPSSGRTADGLLVCPICWKTLKRGSDNAALNQHVDMCLNAEVISDDDSEDDVVLAAPPVRSVDIKPKNRAGSEQKGPKNAFDVMMHRKPPNKKKKAR